MTGNFQTWDSVTHSIRVGCGTLYLTILTREKGRFERVFIHRNSKFYCPLTTRHSLEKLATYQGRRSVKQLIRDLRGEKPLTGKVGHYCEKYTAVAEATSCFDAVSKIMERWQKQKRKRKK